MPSAKPGVKTKFYQASSSEMFGNVPDAVERKDSASNREALTRLRKSTRTG